MSDTGYKETIAATRIGTWVERFTPEFEVVSVSIALSEDGESEALSIQRAFGAEAGEDEGICLVLSPSQQCRHKPFQQLTLERHSIGMRFTAEAQSVFKVASARFLFMATDAEFQEFKEKLEVVCNGESYFICEENTI